MSSLPILLRQIIPSGSSNRPGAAKCTLDSCNKSTREGKPYCSLHIEHGSYVQTILEELALRDHEATLLDEGKPVDKKGHIVREAAHLLDQGSYTAARLARLLDITHCAAETLIRFMSLKGLAKMGRTDRGAITIQKL